MEIRYLSFREFFDLAQERAEHFLHTSSRQDVLTQLASRRISRISLKPFLCMRAYLHIDGPSYSFTVSLSDKGDLSEHLLSVGHELAHTFEFFNGSRFLKPPYFGSLTNYLHRDIEKFCEVFAHRWLNCGHVKSQLSHLLQTELEWCLGIRHLKPISDPMIVFLPATHCQLRFKFP